MKVDWKHVIFFVIMIGVWLMVMASFIKLGSDHDAEIKSKKDKREQNLRSNFSRLSDGKEIQEAYKNY